MINNRFFLFCLSILTSPFFRLEDFKVMFDDTKPNTTVFDLFEQSCLHLCKVSSTFHCQRKSLLNEPKFIYSTIMWGTFTYYCWRAKRAYLVVCMLCVTGTAHTVTLHYYVLVWKNYWTVHACLPKMLILVHFNYNPYSVHDPEGAIPQKRGEEAW